MYCKMLWEVARVIVTFYVEKPLMFRTFGADLLYTPSYSAHTYTR